MAKVTRLTLDQSASLNGGFSPLREVSDDLDAPLKTIGQELRAAREAFGLDLASVSAALKIRVDHLGALEESNSEGLPGRPYAIGFLRSYAAYLGFDPARSVERFKAEIAGRGDPTVQQLTYPTPERRLPQSVVMVLLLLLVTAVAYGGYYLLIAADRVADPPVAALPERLAVPAQEAFVPPAPPQTADLAQIPEGAPTGADAQSAVTAESIPVQLPAGRAYGTQNTNSRITLRVHEPTRILVQGPDRRVFLNRTLAPGDLYHAPNLVGLRVSTPDSGAVEVILDGMSLGFLGTKGALADALSLNPQDLVDRSSRPGAG